MINFIKPNSLIAPLRPHDFHYRGDKFWFDEMIMADLKSDLSWDIRQLIACPVTGHLMYGHGEFARGWMLIEFEPVQEAYQKYVDDTLEKILLSNEL